MSRSKKNRSSKYVSLEVRTPCPLKELGVFTAVLQEESQNGGAEGEKGTVHLKVRTPSNPTPPFQGHVIVWGKVREWRHVLGLAEILAMRTRGAIFRPGSSAPLVSHTEPVDWSRIGSEPRGRLSSHVYDKAWILRRRAICREHLKAYLPHFTDENVYFSESGHILSDVQIFGRAMEAFK